MWNFRSVQITVKLLIFCAPDFFFAFCPLCCTAENHIFPWGFATQNRAEERTESCHTSLHNFMRVCLHKITGILELFWLFGIILFEEHIYHVSSEILSALPKVIVIQS